MRRTARRKGLILLVPLLLSGFPLALKAQQPTLTAVFPRFFHPDSNASMVILYGSNFAPGAQCDFGAGITVDSCIVNSSTQLSANLTISSTASPGKRDVTVTNSGGTTAVLSQAIEVGTAPLPMQTDTFNVQSDSSGTVTLMPSPVRNFGTALLIGLSFWPADVTSVTVLGHPDHPAMRGLANSIFHDAPGNPLYTNYYYVNLNDDNGALPIVINFSGGSTRALIAVAQVKGIFTSGDQNAVQFAYNESTTPTTSWVAAITPEAFNEYLFAWVATRNATTCTNPGSGWAIEGQTNVPAGATICLLDQTVEAPGVIYQAAVNSSTPQDYAMGMIAFNFFSTDFGGGSPPPVVSSADPNSGSPGQHLANVTITGNTFDTGTSPLASFVCSFGAGITVNSCTLDSASQLTADITIVPNAAQGPRSLTVTKILNAGSWTPFYYSSYGSTVAGAFSVVPPPASSDFTISLATPTQTALPGEEVTYRVSLKAGNGFDQAVTLGCSSMPAGVSCLAPPPITPTASGASAIITLVVNDSVAPGTTPNSFTITGAGGSLNHSVPAQVSVAALSATIAPSAATINVGSSANFEVSLTATDAFTGPVTLSCAGLAPGLRCVSPAPATLPGSPTLSVFVDSKPAASSLPQGPRQYGPSPSSRNLPPMIVGLAVLAAAALLLAVILRPPQPQRAFSVPAAFAGNLSSRDDRAGATIRTWFSPSTLGLATFASAFVLAISLISCSGATTTSSTHGLQP